MFHSLRRGDFRYTTIPYQSILSKHFIKSLYPNTLSNTLSKHFIKSLYPSTLSKHFRTAFYRSTLSKHFIQALYASTLSKHFIKVLQRYYKGVHQQSGTEVLNIFKTPFKIRYYKGITKVLQQGIKTSQ